jgi:PEP-CTERM motif
MRSSRKTKRIVSVLSMAAAAALTANAAYGVTLTMYYGSDPNYSNSNNAVIIGNGFSPSYSASSFDKTGSPEYFANHTNVAVSETHPTTITMPIGDYLSLAIDAILTGNVNPDGGENTGMGTRPSNHQVQPSYLGLTSLGLEVPSTDTDGKILTPISTSGPQEVAPASAGFNGGTTYISTAQINTQGTTPETFAPHLGANSGTTGGAYNIVPNWMGFIEPGYVEPNVPGFDSGTMASGNVGIITFPSGGSFNSSGVASNTITGIQEIEQFAASNDVASYANATDFLDSLIYQGLSPGLVTLAPTASTGGTSYWSLTAPGSETSLSQYGQTSISRFDTVNNVPLLVIDVVPEPTSLGLLALGGIALLHRRNRDRS